MNEEEVREILEQNEMIQMCASHFDPETYEMAINELVNDLATK